MTWNSLRVFWSYWENLAIYYQGLGIVAIELNFVLLKCCVKARDFAVRMLDLGLYSVLLHIKT